MFSMNKFLEKRYCQMETFHFYFISAFCYFYDWMKDEPTRSWLKSNNANKLHVFFALNIVPLALRKQMMNQRIYSAVYVKVPK